MIWSKSPDHTRAFGHPVPQSGSLTRRQVALPSSRATPMKTCPALRPRWCPDCSPLRLQDCCLPAGGNRRLSPLMTWRAILVSTTIFFSGLHHAAYLLAFPPASYAHCWVCTWSSLLACWLGFGQVGLEPSVLTHWVTTTNFLGLRPVPRSRASLGATTTKFGGMWPNPLLVGLLLHKAPHFVGFSLEFVHPYVGWTGGEPQM